LDWGGEAVREMMGMRFLRYSGGYLDMFVILRLKQQGITQEDIIRRDIFFAGFGQKGLGEQSNIFPEQELGGLDYITVQVFLHQTFG
jgi:hypothetical protein